MKREGELLFASLWILRSSRRMTTLLGLDSHACTLQGIRE